MVPFCTHLFLPTLTWHTPIYMDQFCIHSFLSCDIPSIKFCSHTILPCHTKCDGSVLNTLIPTLSNSYCFGSILHTPIPIVPRSYCYGSALHSLIPTLSYCYGSFVHIPIPTLWHSCCYGLVLHTPIPQFLILRKGYWSESHCQRTCNF